MKKIIISFFLILLFFMVGFITLPKKQFNCLPKEERISFPIDQYTHQPIPTVYPLDSSWKPQLNHPDKDLLGLQIRIQVNGRVWINSWDHIYSYIPNNKQLKIYTIHPETDQYKTNSIFLTKDGTLWEIGYWQQGTGPILSKYNPDSDQFEPIVDKNNFLITDGNSSNDLVVDSKGNLWITIFGKGLFFYDPVSNLSEQKLQNNFFKEERKDYELKEELEGNIAIDNKDGIWLGANESSKYGNRYSIIYYDNENNLNTTFTLPQDFSPSIFTLFIDKESRLWVDDYAFRSTNDKNSDNGLEGWNLIIRSTDFIYKRSPIKDYEWLNGSPFYEDSDGNIWFSSFGLVQLNTKSSKWCRVIEDTSNTNLAEDKNGNFWIVLNGQIYKY